MRLEKSIANKLPPGSMTAVRMCNCQTSNEPMVPSIGISRNPHHGWPTMAHASTKRSMAFAPNPWVVYQAIPLEADQHPANHQKHFSSAQFLSARMLAGWVPLLSYCSPSLCNVGNLTWNNKPWASSPTHSIELEQVLPWQVICGLSGSEQGSLMFEGKIHVFWTAPFQDSDH